MEYKIKVKSDIAESFIPMSELQDQLRLYDPHEESLLMVYRAAAIDFAERYMNRAIGLQTVIGSAPVYLPRMYLPYGEIDSVISLHCTSADEIKAIPEDGYSIHPVTNELMIKREYSACSDFIVAYKVGYQIESIPAAIKLGCMKLVSTWYEAREDVSFGVSVQEVPFNHRACFDLYRIPAGS